MLIGLVGYSACGKDSLAQKFIELRPEFQRVAFADGVRDLTYGINWFVRSLVDRIGWDAAKRNYPAVRETLQTIGLAARGTFGEDVWVDRTLGDYGTGSDWVVTDVRFPNEADRIRELGGYVVRVRRDGVGPVNAHISETAMDSYTCDAVIHNDATPIVAAGKLSKFLALSKGRKPQTPSELLALVKASGYESEIDWSQGIEDAGRISIERFVADRQARFCQSAWFESLSSDEILARLVEHGTG